MVGGYPATISDVPYIVNIRAGGQLICGGTLVHRRFVVTAASCIWKYYAPQMIVQGNTANFNEVGLRRKVNRVIYPAAYNTQTLDFDVAMLRLDSPMNGANTVPIGLYTNGVPVGATLKVSGWGQVSENGNNSNQLQSVLVTSIAKDRCLASYELTSTMFCARGPGTDACEGDGGGPAVYNGQLAGIISWGFGCARPNYPGVYTSIAMVAPFINQAIRNNS
ncbi:trypsin alpha-3-like [Teleopsis dalmanni]|uniref:trypsin alpha-3-like n=1 Tax=Teleopsis dalmanni TaxID=139649 RepID=UPI0018CEBEB2|nr:trypsin alpha-3-like [Teleopsis dalmanni]